MTGATIENLKVFFFQVKFYLCNKYAFYKIGTNYVSIFFKGEIIVNSKTESSGVLFFVWFCFGVFQHLTVNFISKANDIQIFLMDVARKSRHYKQ